MALEQALCLSDFPRGGSCLGQPHQSILVLSSHQHQPSSEPEADTEGRGNLLSNVAETQVVQARIAASGGVVRPPSAGQVLEQRQPPVALDVWGSGLSLLLGTQAAEQLCLFGNCVEKLWGN